MWNRVISPVPLPLSSGLITQVVIAFGQGRYLRYWTGDGKNSRATLKGLTPILRCHLSLAYHIPLITHQRTSYRRCYLPLRSISQQGAMGTNWRYTRNLGMSFDPVLCDVWVSDLRVCTRMGEEWNGPVKCCRVVAESASGRCKSVSSPLWVMPVILGR